VEDPQPVPVLLSEVLVVFERADRMITVRVFPGRRNGLRAILNSTKRKRT
jgi:arginine repressor